MAPKPTSKCFAAQYEKPNHAPYVSARPPRIHAKSSRLEEASAPSARVESEYQANAPTDRPARPVTTAPTRVFGGRKKRTRSPAPTGDAPSSRGREVVASTTPRVRRTAERSW